MNRYLLSMMAAVAVSGLTLSCSSSEEEDLGDANTVVNMVGASKPVKLTEEQSIFVNDNNQFTLNFLKAVNEVDRSGKSFVYSPLSITYVLGMVNAAAIGQTEQELVQTLGFHSGGIRAVNDYCKNLIDNLPLTDEKVTLNIANAIFLNQRYTLLPQFQKDMQTYYDAKAEALDFSATSTLDHINGWCKEKTNGMIPNILNEVEPDMVSYLLNAIYFKADWASKFDTKNTKDEDFAGRKLPMMHQNVLISYVRNDTYAAVNIPYGNGRWSMVVMLPEDGKTTDDIVNYLAGTGWSNAYVADGMYVDAANPMSDARLYEVDLKLPRYETLSDTDDLSGFGSGYGPGLVGLMQKLGVWRAFTDDAEIPNMATLADVNVPLKIAMMRQKARIKVNEEGSEAAAVTIAGMDNFSANPEPPVYPKAEFHANRPFVYVIREASSGVILFVGKFTGE